MLKLRHTGINHNKILTQHTNNLSSNNPNSKPNPNPKSTQVFSLLCSNSTIYESLRQNEALFSWLYMQSSGCNICVSRSTVAQYSYGCYDAAKQQTAISSLRRQPGFKVKVRKLKRKAPSLSVYDNDDDREYQHSYSGDGEESHSESEEESDFEDQELRETEDTSTSESVNMHTYQKFHPEWYQNQPKEEVAEIYARGNSYDQLDQTEQTEIHSNVVPSVFEICHRIKRDDMVKNLLNKALDTQECECMY